MVHCAFTKAGQKFKAINIIQWQLGPKDVDGGVIYKGIKYKNRQSLPSDMIGGVPIFKLKGRGWKVPGYADVIERSGSLVGLVGYNSDDHVDSWEITNGALGWNGHTRHICLMGGMAENGKDTEDNFTSAQYTSLEAYIKATIRAHPKIRIIGHNQVTALKDCPGFNVPIWGRKHGISIENVDFHNYGGNTHFRFLTDD